MSAGPVMELTDVRKSTPAGSPALRGVSLASSGAS